uniref:hypothetical protein n=1 Tax=Runella sp. TaxID=1960881 RepID=UPI002619C598
QKNKPIAWSEKGNYALSTLRAEALNLAKAASRTLNITATKNLMLIPFSGRCNGGQDPLKFQRELRGEQRRLYIV